VREVVGEFGQLSVPFVRNSVKIRLYFLHGTIATRFICFCDESARFDRHRRTSSL